ncbi:alpha-ketoglutarate-dependent dioxygenase alkB 6 [Biomphalaria pfeifferi]|uniref:Alpha-ketoglutarate-dependent dioxygenase alkB 6 n=1 Tax=Biomphalaria pfeifferi TaxID=112525 RepID=A0AAD8FCK9_BIOPF|nr:alpha-ketoglutarate-dependent dioxygenase alkB 6 [Biomphalaria pfeifferi]
MNCEIYRISKSPHSLYYIPNFISQEEEECLLNKVYSAPKPKWTQLSHRKLQNWGGLPHNKGMVVEDLPPWLKTYADKIGSFSIFEDKKPNHVLVNEYLPGQGIMPHEDGPLFYPVVTTINLGSHTFLDFYTPIDGQDDQPQNKNTNVTVCDHNESKQKSFNDESSFEKRYFLSVLLEPRSLIMVCDDMYKIYLHGIAEKKSDIVTDKVANLNTTPYAIGDTLDRKTRVSLTFRYVPKVLKAKLVLGKK